jgi:tripartite-type tricarboxylate transporter receptor subunit TctC
MLRLVLALLLCAAGAAGAAFPERPIRLVVPQAPGSATDTLARILATQLSAQVGQPVVVDNRPGGALTIGMELTARSAPDGYTICMSPVGALAISRHLVAKLPYDIERDFQPIGLVTRGHLLLAASPALPVRSVPELLAHARANPGKLLFGSSGNGTPGHVGGELFKSMARLEIVHVPYKGGAAATNDLVAGHVHLIFESLGSIAPHARSGKVRALAVSGAKRSPGFPDLPTIAEAGVPGYEAPTWSGVVAPAGVPRDRVEVLNAAINQAIRTPIFLERFAQIGDEPAGGTPEAFGEMISRESRKWGELIRRIGAKID